MKLKKIRKQELSEEEHSFLKQISWLSLKLTGKLDTGSSFSLTVPSDQEDNWQPTAMSKELNVSVDEVLELVKSARLPVYHRRTDGAIQAH
jgi:hypothetical protein